MISKSLFFFHFTLTSGISVTISLTYEEGHARVFYIFTKLCVVQDKMGENEAKKIVLCLSDQLPSLIHQFKTLQVEHAMLLQHSQISLISCIFQL